MFDVGRARDDNLVTCVAFVRESRLNNVFRDGTSDSTNAAYYQNYLEETTLDEVWV